MRSRRARTASLRPRTWFEFNVFTHSLGLELHDTSQLGLDIDASVSRPNLDLAAVLSF